MLTKGNATEIDINMKVVVHNKKKTTIASDCV